MVNSVFHWQLSRLLEATRCSTTCRHLVLFPFVCPGPIDLVKWDFSVVVESTKRKLCLSPLGTMWTASFFQGYPFQVCLKGTRHLGSPIPILIPILTYNTTPTKKDRPPPPHFAGDWVGGISPRWVRPSETRRSSLPGLKRWREPKRIRSGFPPFGAVMKTVSLGFF